ncbi:MAG: hypothetical protein ACR2QH_16685 [Geminicoccaceae bacterium]
MKNNVSSRHHPNLDDRQAAERELCRLFKSFGIDAMAAPDRLIAPFIDRAAQFWHSHGGLDLASLALEEASVDLRAWFGDLLSHEEGGERAALTTGRAAFLLSGGPKRFADMFLRQKDELSVEFLDAIRNHVPLAVPPSDHGDMKHQPYEAWSFRHVVAKAMPIDKGLMQGLGSLIRRDGGGPSFGWWNSGSTS